MNIVLTDFQIEATLHTEDGKTETLAKEYKNKKRAIDLLANADENIKELQGIANSSTQRLTQLATQWEDHRVPLIEEYRQLRDRLVNIQVQIPQTG